MTKKRRSKYGLGSGLRYTTRHSVGRTSRRGADVMLVKPAGTTATPAYAIGRAISDALDPTQAPGKVRTMADMTPEELAKLTPPRRGR